MSAALSMTGAAPAAPKRRRASTKKAPVKAGGEVAIIRAAVRSSWQDAMIQRRVAPERHQIGTEAGVNTGYWSWKGNYHGVVIGEEIREKVKAGKGLDRYIAKFLRHELSHAKRTERDLKKLDAEAKKVKVPFRLLNLFEDARIEAADVRETGEAFAWLEHEPMPEAASAAASFFCLVQAEGAMLPEWDALPSTDFRNRAAHYYRRTIDAVDSWAVIPIAAEFVKEFPSEQDVERIPNFMADMIASLTVAMGGTVGTGMTVVVEVKGGAEPKGAVDPDKREDAPRGHGYSSAVVLPPDKFKPLNADQMTHAKQLANRLSKEFIARKGWTSTEAPTRRLNSRRLALDTDAIYRNRTELSPGKVKIRVVIDLSGSMGGAPSVMVRVVLTAMAILAQRGHAEGFVILSAQHGYETYPLAMSDKQIAHLEGYSGSEGLARTFRSLETMLAEGDLIMCLTDGHITDGPVDVERLRRKGIRCLGLYLGDPAYSVDLAKWFSSYLCRETMQELIDEIGVRARPIIRARAVRS